MNFSKITTGFVLVFYALIFLFACKNPPDETGNNKSEPSATTTNFIVSSEKEEQMEDSILGTFNQNNHEVFFSPITEETYKRNIQGIAFLKDSLCNDEIYEGTYICLELLEKKYLLNETDFVILNSDSLVIKLKNRRRVVFQKNLQGDDDYTNYYYLGLMESGFFRVAGSFGEGSSYSLIDSRTGEVTSMMGESIESPNGKRVFSMSSDLSIDFDPNGIQLWKIEKGKLVKEWERKFYDWGPKTGYWINDSTIYMKQNVLGPEKKQPKFYSIKLIR